MFLSSSLFSLLAQDILVHKGDTNMFQVFVEYDGCPDEKPVFKGSEKACRLYLRLNWNRFNKGKQSLMLVGETGRAISFIL